MTTTYISEAEIIGRLSEYILKTGANQRVVITKNNDPIAALVNIEDFHRIEQKEHKEGLASVMGRWDGFDEIGEILGDRGGFGRDVSF
ncbi:type II toxin-antitoxin system prevent-host-death family antitoxin [Desulfococcaceae bacterium HSG8]|nr:type II toxin-antitoxin system prevent-host-death family antitoxin [Desulfococcaceae bacterium HSG8]